MHYISDHYSCPADNHPTSTVTSTNTILKRNVPKIEPGNPSSFCGELVHQASVSHLKALLCKSSNQLKEKIRFQKKTSWHSSEMRWHQTGNCHSLTDPLTDRGKLIGDAIASKNIATGKTLQAITPFHFFDYFMLLFLWLLCRWNVYEEWGYPPENVYEEWGIEELRNEEWGYPPDKDGGIPAPRYDERPDNMKGTE